MPFLKGKDKIMSKTTTLDLASLMDKTPNDKSIWQQSKGVFNDGTEIISEAFEAGAELVRAVRKSLNLLNLQIDETIILQKISLVGVIMQAGEAINMTEEEAVNIVVAQLRN